MSSPVARSAELVSPRHSAEALRVAFLGPQQWLDGCAPPAATPGLIPTRLASGAGIDLERELAALEPHVSVIFDPAPATVAAARTATGVTLGVIVGALPAGEEAHALGDLDRLLSFDPALTGTALGGGELWRAIPPPVSDLLFGEVRPLRHAPRALTIGAWSHYRETMLVLAKHHHDLLEVIHGVSGEPLRELLEEADVGVFVAAEPGGGFGPQVPLHLAAGHLLLSSSLTPAHGLERDIDYLHFDSAEGLAWVLGRLARFPEMHQRIRIRGRLKAEQYRASRVFTRIASDLLADVAAFGGAPGAGRGA